MKGSRYYPRIDWWSYLSSLPEPRVIVIADIDDPPGVGAFMGEIQAAIGKALSCVGCVTNGAVRDLVSVNALGFSLFSGSVAVSHSYAHIIDFGGPVEVGGLTIQPGQLLHGDRHGVHVIPLEIAQEVPAMARRIQDEEREFLEFCRSGEFSLQELSVRMQSKMIPTPTK
jgi:regulator of RNase E activity RraA